MEMATFEIQRKEDMEVVFSGRITDWAAFQNELISIRGAGQTSLGFYFVRGKSVSIDEAIDAAKDAESAWIEKRNKTHKFVMISQGVTNLPNTYRGKWIRR
jgi:hypothetical protein